MSVQVAKEELNSLTEFQREIHVTENLSEEIISNFYRAFIKSTWYSSIPMKLAQKLEGNTVIYTVNNTFHFLIYSYLRFVTPAIKVKSQYKGRVRICWTHNLGTNIYTNAVFKEDDERFHEFDNYWSDIYYQFYQDSGAGKRDGHNIGIGNIKCLEDWSEFLPPCPINVDQPWFYSMDHALAFPIFYKNSQTRAEHKYTMRRKISDLLRVQYLDVNSNWKDKIGNIDKYLDISQDETIDVPELWGRYAYISDTELKWYRCKQNRLLYIRDIEVCDASNPNKYKSTSEVPLHCTNPCLAFFWVAENTDSSVNNNYSNYTTNTQSLYDGWDPISNITLKYGTTPRLNKMPSDHFSLAEPRKHFPSTPCERGYHGYSFAWDSTSYHGDVGIVLGNMKATLFCEINNGDIYKHITKDILDIHQDDDDDIIPLISDTNTNVSDYKVIEQSPNLGSLTDEQSPNFITRVRLLIIRKFIINNVENNYTFKVI